MALNSLGREIPETYAGKKLIPYQNPWSLQPNAERSTRAIRRIAGGDIALRPYRLGTASACDYCGYSGICRLDGRTGAAWEVLDGDKTVADVLDHLKELERDEMDN